MACNTAGPGFRGVDPVKVVEDGATFLIRVKDHRAEVIRTNAEPFPKFAQVAEKAKKATARVTQCTADWVVGDPAMMTIGLACNGQPAPPKPVRKPSFVCDILEGRHDALIECYED